MCDCWVHAWDAACRPLAICIVMYYAHLSVLICIVYNGLHLYVLIYMYVYMVCIVCIERYLFVLVFFYMYWHVFHAFVCICM